MEISWKKMEYNGFRLNPDIIQFLKWFLLYKFLVWSIFWQFSIIGYSINCFSERNSNSHCSRILEECFLELQMTKEANDKRIRLFFRLEELRYSFLKSFTYLRRSYYFVPSIGKSSRLPWIVPFVLKSFVKCNHKIVLWHVSND